MGNKEPKTVHIVVHSLVTKFEICRKVAQSQGQLQIRFPFFYWIRRKIWRIPRIWLVRALFLPKWQPKNHKSPPHIKVIVDKISNTLFSIKSFLFDIQTVSNCVVILHEDREGKSYQRSTLFAELISCKSGFVYWNFMGHILRRICRVYRKTTLSLQFMVLTVYIFVNFWFSLKVLWFIHQIWPTFMK